MEEHRGKTTFNDADLLAALASCPVDEGSYSQADGIDLKDYDTFYRLDFDNTTRTIGVVAVAGERIAVQTFCPAQPKRWAVVSHGYYDHVGLYGHLIQQLLNRQVGVLIFDHIGHGLSTGSEATISSFQCYVDVLACIHKLAPDIIGCEPFHWIGQSMGGAVLMEYEQQNALAPSGEFILLAPLIRPYGWSALKWYFALIKHWITARPRDLRSNMPKPFMRFLAADPLQAKTLPVAWVQAMVNWFKQFENYPGSRVEARIVHGGNDKTVSYRHNLPLLDRRYQRGSILTIPDARHHLVNETPKIQSLIWQWLDDECCW